MTVDLKKELISIRRAIHKYPELGNEEFKTSALVAKVLKKYGIKVKHVAGTGILGMLEGTKKNGINKTIALRADMDALPIEEISSKLFRSKRRGIMHACGHDGNTSIVLGAAMLLSQMHDKFGGKVLFLFQPNEETSGGARSMINAGVLKSPRPDAIVGVHVYPWLDAGKAGFKPGSMMAAVDKFTIEVIGEGGHGAYPHLGKDAIVVASEIVLGLQTLVSREIDPVEPVVLTIGTINGGERFNIISGKVTMTGTVRTLNPATRAKMRKSIEKKVKHITAAYSSDFKITYEELGSPLINNERVLRRCMFSASKVLGQKNIITLEKPSMGGEDFAEYLRYVPGCFIYIGAKTGNAYPWHHERFDMDESSLPAGAKVLSEIAKDFLK